MAQTTVTGREATLSLAVAAGATMLVLMNYTAPNTTLPQMAADLGAGAAGRVWILGAIGVGMAAALIATGGLADAYGRRRIFLIGSVTLAAALVGGALASATWLFVVARIVQGAASAALTSSGLGMIGHAFPPGPQRVRATGVWGAMLSAGLLLGPIVSAALAEPLSWRAPYWLLAALAGALAAAARGLPESRADQRRGGDLPGVLTLGLGVAALIAALTIAHDGWIRPEVLGAAGLAALLLASFVAIEARRREPLLELGLFRRPLFLAATAGALFTGIAIIGIAAYLPAVLQQTVGQTPLTSAAVIGIWAATSFASALQTRRLPLAATHQLAASFGLSATGWLILLGMIDAYSWPQAVIGLAIAGVGSGIGNAALARLAVESVPADSASLGSGATNAARYIGAALGVALVITIITSSDTAAAGTDRALIVSAALALMGAGTALALHRRSTHHPQ